MRVSVLIAIALLAFCLSVNGWGWGGRRSSRSSRSSSSSRRTSRSSRFWRRPTSSSRNPPSNKDSSSRNPSNNEDSSSGNPSNNEDNSSEGIHLTIKGSIEISYDRGAKQSKDDSKDETNNDGKQRRSVHWYGNHYNITLTIDPCDFNTYDDQRDGFIDRSELQAIFGNTEQTDALFADLDEMDDGSVTEEEFYDRAPVIINACMDTGE